MSFLKDLFKRAKYSTVSPDTEVIVEKEVPDGLFYKCPVCHNVIYMEKFKERNYVCPNCKNYSRLDARTRIGITIDPLTFKEFDTDLKPVNFLSFTGYNEKMATAQEKTGLNDAIVTGEGEIFGNKVCIGVMDSNFMMGSMGSVVGEKLTRLFEYATEKKLPVILFTCSGGARMQEGIVSLMQMAKVSGAVSKHSNAGLLYITVLTDPTTGGVTASFAMLGDIIIAEPRATIGFAGRRVIENTIGETLPNDFQSSEFQCEHGFVDMVLKRKYMKRILAKLVELHTPKAKKEVVQDASEEN